MDKSFNCLLIGAGKLGSRYLQGLSRVGFPLKITVVDPSREALEQARIMLSESSMEQHHSIEFAESVGDSPQKYDLSMVVTPAHCRKELVSEINRCHHVNAWILEKPLAQSSKDVLALAKELRACGKVWVNTPRRLMPWHRAIKNQLLLGGPASLRVRLDGGNWGLACNAIHFIDLVSWWTGAKVEDVNSQSLGDWQPSKRAGFWEVFGSLVVTFMDRSVLELSCSKCDAPPKIEVETPESLWLINEAVGNAIGPSGQNIAGRLNFQSALTAPLVEQILCDGCCDLPTLPESAAQHRPFLDALLQHWNHSQSRQDLVTPIT